MSVKNDISHYKVIVVQIKFYIILIINSYITIIIRK